MSKKKSKTSFKRLEIPRYFVEGVHRITITVVGAGGTGSLLLTKLARLSKALNQLDHPGFHVTCVDYDIVEEHNIGRQMFVPSDIGCLKAENLITKINKAFGFDWDSICTKYEKDHSASNITICCVDNIETRKEAYEFFYDRKNYFQDDLRKYFIIDCGNARDFGQVIISDREKNLKTFFDLFPNPEKTNTVEIQGHGCSYLESLKEQDLFINDLVSFHAANMIKELFFKKQLDYQGIIFNSTDLLTRKIPIKWTQKEK